jgi:hypothetical protein
VLGGLFVLVTVFLPRGIVGTLAGLRLQGGGEAPDGESRSRLRAENA